MSERSTSDGTPHGKGVRLHEEIALAKNLPVITPESTRNEAREILTIQLMDNYHFRTTHDGTVWILKEGIYTPTAENVIHTEVLNAIGTEYLKDDTANVVDRIKGKTYVEWETFKEDENTIVLENGILNIRYWINPEYRNKDPNKENVFTNLITEDTTYDDLIHFSKFPVKYDPAATCPVIEKFLHEVLPSEEYVAAMYEWIGYHLYKRQSFQKASLWIGVGCNGKTVMGKLLTAFVGKDNTTSMTLEQICNNTFATAELFGKVANIGSEMTASRLRDTEIFKKLIGEDKINAQRKFKDPFEFCNLAKVTFYGNKLPQTKNLDSDYAYFRRFLIWEFPNIFDGSKKDEQLIGKLTTPTELSGLLNRALEGLQRLLTNHKFSNEKPWEEVRIKYLVLSDLERAFIEAEIEEVEDEDYDGLDGDVCYKFYREFCKKQGKPANSKRLLTIRMQEETHASSKPTTRDGKRIRVYTGVKLKHAPSPETSKEKVQLETEQTQFVPTETSAIPEPEQEVVKPKQDDLLIDYLPALFVRNLELGIEEIFKQCEFLESDHNIILKYMSELERQGVLVQYDGKYRRNGNE